MRHDGDSQAIGFGSECGQYSYSTLKPKEYMHSKPAGSCLCQSCSNPALTVIEAGDGVADLTMASGKRLTRLQRRTVGKHSRFDLSMPYLRLNVLSAAFQEVADAPHPLPAILNVVETRH